MTYVFTKYHFLFSPTVIYPMGGKFIVAGNIWNVSANAFSLDRTKTLWSGKGLTSIFSSLHNISTFHPLYHVSHAKFAICNCFHFQMVQICSALW